MKQNESDVLIVVVGIFFALFFIYTFVTVAQFSTQEVEPLVRSFRNQTMEVGK